ncbi:hypothetical protein D3C78_1099770 [compost metagenome]
MAISWLTRLSSTSSRLAPRSAFCASMYSVCSSILRGRVITALPKVLRMLSSRVEGVTGLTSTASTRVSPRRSSSSSRL